MSPGPPRALMPTAILDTTAHADAALFGHDVTPHLVALYPIPPDASNDAQAYMRVYRRQPDTGHLHAENVPFYPFFFSPICSC